MFVRSHAAHRVRFGLTGSCTLLLLAVLTGCSTLPDAGRLAEASAQLSAAVTASGELVADELELAGQPERARALREAWQTPARSGTAIARYADALAAVISAGAAGSDSVRRVADAGQTLAAGVGLALPATAAAATGVDLAAEVYRQIAAVRATAVLADALDRMQPVVDRTTGLVAAQLDDVRAILINAQQIEAVQLRTRFADETGYLLALRRERVALYEAPALTPANAERLLQIDRVEGLVLGRLAPMHAALESSQQRLRAGLQLIGTARQALTGWAQAHRQLQVAVRTGASVDPRALVQSVLELRELLTKARAR